MANSKITVNVPLSEMVRNINNLITDFYIKEVENLKPDPRTEFKTAAEKAVYLGTFNIAKKEVIKILQKHKVPTEETEGGEQ